METVSFLFRLLVRGVLTFQLLFRSFLSWFVSWIPESSFRQPCLNKVRRWLSLGEAEEEDGKGAEGRDGETGADSGYNFRIQLRSAEDRTVAVCEKGQLEVTP